MDQSVATLSRHKLWKMSSGQLAIITAGVVFFGFLFSYLSGEYAKKQLRNYLISQAQMVAAALPDSLVTPLQGSPADLDNPLYKILKKKMGYLRLINPEVRFVYVLGFRDGQLFFYGDSELPTSSDYSPPGDVYAEANPVKLDGYIYQDSFVEGPYEDRWGKWVSGYAPLLSSVTPGASAGMVGVDISSANWERQVWLYRLIPLLIMMIILVFLVWFYFFSQRSSRLITEVEGANVKLAESEKKFKHVAENIPGMIYQLLVRPNGDMKFLYVSDACEDMYGLSQEDIVKDALLIRQAVEADDLASFTETIAKATTTLSTWIWEGRILNAQTKSIKWVRGVSQPERLSSGDIIWNGVMIDVTDRREAEQRLRENEERLSFALAASSDGLFDMNVVKTTMYYSPRYIDMLGYTGYESELKYVSGEFIDFIHPDDQKKVVPKLQDAILNGEPWNEEYRLRTRQGEYIWFNGRGRTQLNEYGKPLRFAGFITDITERKRTEQAKTEFVSIASHQLRTPLTSISWYSEMLLDGSAGVLAQEQKEYLQQIYESNQRMVALVNSLLNVSRIDMGTFAIDPEPLNFIDVARSVVAELKPQTVSKKITLNEVYDPNVPIINADPKLVRIIFQNLLSNAVKYTQEEGKVQIDIKVGKPAENTQSDDDMLIIEVTDNGYGIPEGQKNHIFTKLFRADNAREKVAEGTGLGLYVVKSIVEAAEGKIWFESVENKGTTFHVILPLSGMSKKVGTKGLT